jgi:hypothetical protein
MMVLRPGGTIDLEHRAFFLRGVPRQSVIVAAAEDGRFSILGPDLKDAYPDRLSSKIKGISPHPSGQWLAAVGGESGALWVQDLAGHRLLEVTPPEVHANAPKWVKPGFEDCLFDESGEFLWLAALRSGEECEIQLMESAGWSIVATATAKDPFGGSSCSFQHTGRPGLVSLWLAAGQDGQQVYWLNRSRNGFSCTFEPHLTNTIPPVFAPSGERLLVVNENYAICQYEFPGMRQVGLSLQSGDEANPFAESLAYLNERQALASSNEGRIFVVDTLRMEIEGEVALEGHEPRPIGVHYPNLAHEGGIGTDISYFQGLGSIIVFVYRRDRRKSLEEWKDDVSDRTPPLFVFNIRPWKF